MEYAHGRPRSGSSTSASASLVVFASSLVIIAAPACVAPEVDEPSVETATFAYTVPAKGTATTLDVAAWNLEWFGDTSRGPTNDTLQRQNAYDVITGADMDLWGVEEIVSVSQWNTLKSQLTGYAGFLSNDPIVTSGSSYYTTSEQKLGFLYKTSIATVQSARVILTAYDYEFAGRPPLEVKLSVTLNGTTDNVVVIVLHMKALSDSASYQRRLDASAALKSYLDTNYPTQKVFVVGDFNDDLDKSISGSATPYANYLADSADYHFATKVLTDANISSTSSGGATLDHHLITNELALSLVPGSVEAYRVSEFIPSYASTTSDHFPILSRYTWAAAKPAQIVINEICANEPGSSVTGEFVEIVNIGGAPATLDGWTLSDASSVRHTFAAGTTLAAGKSLVVFGTAAGIPAGTPNAIASSTSNLGLANGGDAVYLRDAAGTTKDSFSYPASLAAVDGVSMNRSPDAAESATFVLHTALVAAASSPGTRANGADF
ncbi:lamin tail domain-containing protein [Polyangium jinanense]|uniref:lamin tail domain-containing protein n=1 Tax=Polyangium jinanense TaxID=2829994 RepID=UPI0023411E29|nr:lamin tail domain-containing protein [Polyangium jinanense]MDC3959810.1 lamin tail domain-containing protein [Polyangium jinanense]